MTLIWVFHIIFVVYLLTELYHILLDRSINIVQMVLEIGTCFIKSNRC
jgi:hypothetical protein